jgi:chromosome transmission fidelity protein 8
MIISVNINLPSSSGDATRTKLPPSLAKLGDANADEVVLIELQGLLEVEGSKDKQLVGTLRLGDVRGPFSLPRNENVNTSQRKRNRR